MVDTVLLKVVAEFRRVGSFQVQALDATANLFAPLLFTCEG